MYQTVILSFQRSVALSLMKTIQTQAWTDLCIAFQTKLLASISVLLKDNQTQDINKWISHTH